MLRRVGQSSAETPDSAIAELGFPAIDQPFAQDDRPAGVRFYKGRASFFHPYALLEGMRLEGEVLTLSFAKAEVSVVGRGLHALYVCLSQQRVTSIVEQGERYASSSDAPMHVSRIIETLKHRAPEAQA